MLLRSWLNMLFGGRNQRRMRCARRNRRPTFNTPAMIERLEVRKLLTGPSLQGIESSTLTYVEGNSTAVTSGLNVTDTSSANLASLTVSISSGLQTGDSLSFTAPSGSGITGTYDSTSGMLALSGTDTLAHYNSVIQSIQFSSTALATGGSNRTIAFIANDGTSNSNIASRNISIDFPPVLATNATTALNYTQGATTAVVPNLTVTEPNSGNLSGATIQITSGLQSGEDLLKFTNTGAITGNYVAATGTLTLTGADTAADYQAAIDSVTYQNTNSSPNTSPRTVTIIATDASSATSTPVTRNINVSANTSPPVLAGIETTNLPFTIGSSPTAITATLTVTDAGSANLSGATIKIASGFQAGDFLGFTDTANIKATYSSSTGTLTLTGNDTLANYQAALRSVTYQFINQNQTATNRTVSFQVTDPSSQTSGTVSRTIAVAADVPPALAAIETTPLTYSVGNAAAPITTAVTVTSTGTIASATVQITGNYQNGQDILAFTNTGTITGSFNATTGTLTLTGNDTAANYQTALRSVTYQNTSASATGQARATTFAATDTQGKTGNSVVRTVNVQSSVVVAGLETAALTYTEGAAAVPLTSAITVTDPNNAAVLGATVSITSGFQTGDTLAFTNTSKITGSYNSTTGVLTLTGSDTDANYQAALRSVTFQNTTSSSTASRTVSFQVGTTLPTTAVTRNITVSAATVVLAGVETTALAYSTGQAATPVTSGLTVTDSSNATVTGATVSITTGLQTGDTLAFTNTSKITGSYNSTTGVLTLTGSDTDANYQAALRAVTFNTSSTSTTARTVSFQAGASNTVTRNINVSAVATVPVLSGIESGTLLHRSRGRHSGAVQITNSLTITAANTTDLTGATITIDGFKAGHDTLAFKNTSTITGSFNATTGVLTLTGSDTVANYQAALRSIGFDSDGARGTAGKRKISFQVSNGTTESLVAQRTIRNRR